MIQLSSIRFMLCLVLLGSAVGCSLGGGENWRFTNAWDVRRAVGLKKKDELAPPQVPTRLVSTWQDTVLNRPGQQPQRGFGGRLLFFNAESEDPVRVAGQLVIYAYDDQDRAAYETQPTRRFVFPAERFARHESECQLGPSYSIWLPWDEVGGEQKSISLIARFEPEDGPVIAGDQTRHLLPGSRQLATGEPAPAVKPLDEIQLTSYTQTSEIEPPKKLKRLEVTSIALPAKSWEQRLNRARKEHSSSTATPAATLQGQARTGPESR